jgi:predicted metal-dependent hydrolase
VTKARGAHDRARGTDARGLLSNVSGTSRQQSSAALVRRVVLGGEPLDYRIVRARRRSIGMDVGLSGLTVRASRWVSVREIEATLAEHAAWIWRQVAWWRERRRDVLPQQWKSGAPILYQGRELALALHAAQCESVRVDLLNLTVLHPAPDDEQRVAAYVLAWLRDEALRVLRPWVAASAARVRAAPSVALSNARSEWGSCNRKGEIRLNWRLIHLPPRLAQYVVAHEVAHLVELNHSPRFWAMVEKLFPGHAAARSALQDWSVLLE